MEQNTLMAETKLVPVPVTDAAAPVGDPDRVSAMTLSRKVGQSIHIGDNVVITISSVDIRSKVVRVRIAAPRSIPVNRGEVIDNVARGNLIAATDDTPDAEFVLHL
jgi:carbon storage regulator CsrA